MNRSSIRLALIVVACIASAAHAQSDTYKPGKKTDTAPRAAKPAPKDDTKRDEGKKVFAPGATNATTRAGWSVVIAGFREDNRRELAEEGLRKFQAASGLTGAFVEDRGSVSVIAYGSFDNPTSKEAKSALEKVRSIEVTLDDGRRGRPFAEAYLAPPAEASGSIPEFDLRNARRTNPDALYTLQVGRYGRVDTQPPSATEVAEFRKAAEEAVIRLRREGEQAFYFHGPSGSTITIGLFGKEDYSPAGADGAQMSQSNAVQALRKRFPYNLVNGAGLKESVKSVDANGRPTKTQSLQTSRMVAVPKD